MTMSNATTPFCGALDGDSFDPHRVALRHLSRPVGVGPMRAFERKSGETVTQAVLVVDSPGVIEVDAATIAETFDIVRRRGPEVVEQRLLAARADPCDLVQRRLL